MAYRVQFFIIDREYKPISKYNYIGYFRTQREITQFVKENVYAGNSIDVLYSRMVSNAEYNEHINKIDY